MALSALVFGDLHLGPSRQAPSYSRPSADLGDIDIIISIGDVIDENVDHASTPSTGRKYEQCGRAFFEYLETEFACPIVAVPGNHDPVECTERLVEGLDSVTVLHKQAFSMTDQGVTAAETDFSLVGWGCEQFDLKPELDYLQYPAIDPREQSSDRDIQYWANKCAQDLQAAVGKYLIGALSAGEAAEELGLSSQRDEFIVSLEAFEKRYREIRDLLAECNGTPILCSHETPFGISFDHPRQTSVLHSSLHIGSLPLKLAVVDASVHSVICGHFHTQGFDVIDTGIGHTYVMNLGSPGTAQVNFEHGTAPDIIHLGETDQNKT